MSAKTSGKNKMISLTPMISHFEHIGCYHSEMRLYDKYAESAASEYLRKKGFGNYTTLCDSHLRPRDLSGNLLDVNLGEDCPTKSRLMDSLEKFLNPVHSMITLFSVDKINEREIDEGLKSLESAFRNGHLNTIYDVGDIIGHHRSKVSTATLKYIAYVFYQVNGNSDYSWDPYGRGPGKFIPHEIRETGEKRKFGISYYSRIGFGAINSRLGWLKRKVTQQL